MYKRQPLNTRQEGSPVSLGEACVSGCPIIATDTGGVYERLMSSFQGSSFSEIPSSCQPPLTQIIPPNSPDALAEAILKVWMRWKTESTWPPLNTKQDRIDHYKQLTWSIVGPKHLKIIRSVFPQSQS